MNATNKFKFMGQNLDKMMYMLVTNQNILRYMKYLDNNPLDVGKTDVAEEELKGQFITDIFDPEILEVTKNKMFFHPMEGALETQPIGYDIYMLDIIIPSRYWKLEGQGEFRAFKIAEEIAKKIDGQQVAGIGLIDIIKWKTYRIESSYKGLTLWIKVNSTTRY
jgi:hypothetical protein